MPEQVNKDTMGKIILIKKLLTEPDIWINADKTCKKCGGYIFKCIKHISGGIAVICRDCNKEIVSFNLLEYL